MKARTLRSRTARRLASSAWGQRVKKRFRADVRRNPSRHNEAGASDRKADSENSLGEHGIGVDIADRSQWEAPGATHKQSSASLACLGLIPTRASAGVALRQRLDQALPRGLVRRLGDLAVAAAKNSCSWSLIRSHGGLPSTTSKPPPAKTSGNSSGQWKKRWSCGSAPAQSSRRPGCRLVRRVRSTWSVVGMRSAAPGAGFSSLAKNAAVQRSQAWRGAGSRRAARGARDSAAPWRATSSGRLVLERIQLASGAGDADLSGGEILEPNRPTLWPSRSCRLRSLQVAGDLLVVAGERLVGVVRDALLQHVEVEDADQAVAELDVVVEEGERAAGVVALDPERHLAEVDRERVAVDGVDAVADHVADRARGAPRAWAPARRCGPAPAPCRSAAPRRAGSGPSRRLDRRP